MSERERFEAWARTQPRHEGASMRFLPLNNAYIDFDLHGAWLAWQAARSGQAASGSSQGARSDEAVKRFSIKPWSTLAQLKDDEDLELYVRARIEAEGVGVGQPEAPTAAPLPENATEPMQKAMQRAVMLRKSMNDVWRAALAELPEPSPVVGTEVERLRQALLDITDPIAAWKRDLQEGYELDVGMCVHMTADPETYKRMAREALSEQSSPALSAPRKKPVVVAATQWFKNGDHPLDYSQDHDGFEGGELRVFTGAERKANGWEGDIVRYYRRPDVPGESACEQCGKPHHIHGWIDTLEQGHRVCPGDWIITGVKGEMYPCKPDIFAATYEPAEPQSTASGCSHTARSDGAKE